MLQWAEEVDEVTNPRPYPTPLRLRLRLRVTRERQRGKSQKVQGGQNPKDSIQLSQVKQSFFFLLNNNEAEGRGLHFDSSTTWTPGHAAERHDISGDGGRFLLATRGNRPFWQISSFVHFYLIGRDGVGWEGERKGSEIEVGLSLPFDAGGCRTSWLKRLYAVIRPKCVGEKQQQQQQ